MKRFLKRYLPLLLSLAAVFAIVGSTYAYLVATDNEIINSFKFAGVDTSTHEEMNEEFQKEVWFTNDNVSAVYIRARVLVSTGDVGATVKYDNTQPAANEISVIWNNTNWEFRDGWFYYTQVLPGKAETDTTSPTTAPLLYRVIVGDGVDTTKSFEVDVYEESVLTSATGAVDIGNAIAAFGTA